MEQPNKAKKAKGKARGPDVKADGETKEAASAVPVDKPNKEFKFWKTQPVAQFGMTPRGRIWPLPLLTLGLSWPMAL